jgi:hypothetical protein
MKCTAPNCRTGANAAYECSKCGTKFCIVCAQQQYPGGAGPARFANSANMISPACHVCPEPLNSTQVLTPKDLAAIADAPATMEFWAQWVGPEMANFMLAQFELCGIMAPWD